MENKKEFKIINQKKYKELKNKKIASSIALTAMSACLIAMMGVSSKLIDPEYGAMSLFTSLCIEPLLGVTTILSEVAAIINLHAARKLKKYHNNAEDKDNIEIPAELYEMTLKI